MLIEVDTIKVDTTETLRRARTVELNAGADRQALERRHGMVWDTGGLARDFKVIGFMAPYAVVRRKADGVMGSVEFQHHPRFYFNWQGDQ